MADRKSFLLRIDATLLEALRRWSEQDLRSLNGHLEYLLREAAIKAGRFDAESLRGESRVSSAESPEPESEQAP